ncbi:MAG: AraC family transcriptional regulator [Puniceicoccales bacterium]|jgi:AraC-like DNA-binding protein|nr:AraC family transcriptional regulator [Puniceicoccales bacterium]
MKLTRPKVYFAGFWTHDLGELESELRIVGEGWTIPGWQIREDTHPDWEFKLQISGTSYWTVEGQPLSLEPNTLYGIAPGVRHAMEKPARESTQFLFCRIAVDNVLKRNPELRADWQGKKFFRLENALVLKPTLLKLVREAVTDNVSRVQITRALIDLFLLEITRLGTQGDMLVPTVTQHKGLARALSEIDRNFHRNLSVAHLAGIAGVSPGHFGKLFQAEKNMSPRDYWMEKRIEAAKDVLANTDRSVTDIALDLGFASSQHFAREFKSITGQTPSDYRGRVSHPS